jgi:hypothetical protein
MRVLKVFGLAFYKKQAGLGGTQGLSMLWGSGMESLRIFLLLVNKNLSWTGGF